MRHSCGDHRAAIQALWAVAWLWHLGHLSHCKGTFSGALPEAWDR